MENNIKAIIFDWGGVCCSEGEPFASLELQEKIGKHPNDIADDIKDLYFDFYRGKYSEDEFWNAVISHFNLEKTDGLNPASLSAAYLNSYEPWPDILDVAKKLQAKYKVGLLSDLTKVMRDHIKKEHNISEYFPVAVYSCDDDAGRLKTDGPELFNLILGKMAVLPEECLFIDNSKSKIEAAKNAGLNTMLFDNKEQFFKDIEKYE
ncbi:MAG: hypothetical protein A2469_01625 [Candidatus Magasanikbacteria bacterium RIFOXYC2_FULL_40_16]|uniref:HAD family hydrolase n=3 Tax=Candidatus Magasanikiibacteriota TaxID=1752731 RepID=A0A1F6NIX8_9BACT|nr:MAG: hypothetical protein A2224_01030 [Candidatus Magasanikbacteria bacterium RIFOXYA2_FULL_40_20]OGH83917.1 MAG: hypothetical protein A2373_01145 [Candidatus Magasanikbacteria bacterium RIFOXYB1_FULL_40_15]OGH85745.1 MAG: hypothetical protein A2301_03590 [Candidatus Magasanikbacteria bacterium RIFOXYB2_FULL_40_13]OGH87196.1 MAG: hypothetical protein A2206_01180 [Candidatus Magasanikbacteria bacterium RIFOXYA1_FULL_40_8]OGH89276.1 MAG: hypothetical protein A2469_01625 [Candidatus Magasanikba